MDIQVRERLVGALILVALVVLFVPAVLKGPSHQPRESSSGEQQVVEFPLPEASAPPADDRLVPESEAEAETASTVAIAAPESAPEQEEPPAAQQPPATAPAEPEPVRTAVVEPPSGTVSGQPAWAVQLGAFSTREKAEGLVAELRRRGYPAFFLEYRADGKLLHRVRVGPEQDRARAVAIADRLRKDGYLPVVAPHP